MNLDPAVAATRVAVRRTLSDLEPGATVLVACSGGADSLALLAATVFEARHDAWHVVGVTVDHGLQDGSAERAVHVVEQMTALGADETVTAAVDVHAEGQGIEAAARQARYAVLEEYAERAGAAVVLLGHTLDDQAETVLLGLARGSGGRSIAGMRRAFDRYRRPFLDLNRRDTATACLAQGIEVWRDPHNDDPRFARARVRHTVLPMLETELGPGVAATLARTADLLREDMELLDELAESALATTVTDRGVDVATLATLAPALRRRVLRLAALAAGSPGSDLFHVHVVELDRLVTDWHGQGPVQLPGPVGVRRVAGALIFDQTAVGG